jgi:hypothetical protein
VKHPQNGPSLSKAPPKKRKTVLAASPARRQAELEQTARDCAKTREFNKDPVAWMQEHMLKGKR